MALDFDINSALAGAQTAYNLATAPEKEEMQRRLQEEQLATSKQQRELTGFELQQKQKQAANQEAILAGNQKLAEMESLKAQSLALAGDRSQPIDIRRKGMFNILQKGHMAVLENNPETVGRNVVDEGNKLTTEYGQLVSAMQANNGQITQDTQAQVNDMVNRAAKYSANFQTEYDKNSFTGQLMTDGSINIYAKDKAGKQILVDTYKDPHELATTISQDNRVLDSVTDTIKASLAKYGDQTWKEVESKNKYLTSVQTLAQNMPTKELQDQANLFLNFKEEAFTQALPKLLDARNAYFNTKTGIESRALLEPYLKDVRSKIAKIKNGSDQVRYLDSLDIDQLIPVDVQRQIAEKGGDVRAILNKELFGDKSLFERVEKGGELKVKEREAGAKEVAAASGSERPGTKLAMAQMQQKEKDKEQLNKLAVAYQNASLLTPGGGAAGDAYNAALQRYAVDYGENFLTGKKIEVPTPRSNPSGRALVGEVDQADAVRFGVTPSSTPAAIPTATKPTASVTPTSTVKTTPERNKWNVPLAERPAYVAKEKVDRQVNAVANARKEASRINSLPVNERKNEVITVYDRNGKNKMTVNWDKKYSFDNTTGLWYY